MTSRTTPEGLPPLPAGQAIEQAITLHQAGRLQEAEQLYRAALKIQPSHPLANHNLGVLAGQSRRPETGLPFLKAALDADPSQTQFWVSYANALLSLGRSIEALQIMDTALARGLDSPALRSLKQEAVLVSDGHTERVPGPEAEFGQLVELFNAGHYAELETRARALLDRHPESGFAWKVLGASLQLQGKDGLSALRRAADLLPGDADAQNNLGNALQSLGQVDGAAASYRRALQLKPDYAEANANLGNALHSLGQLDAAVDSYRRALAIKPNYAKTHNNLGRVLHDLGRPNDAIASYRQALLLDSEYAEAHNNLGNVLREIGQLDDALASCREAVRIRPDYAEAHSNLGNALQSLGQVDSAIASYHHALSLDPDLDAALSNLGSALQERGLLGDAIACYRRALESDPHNAGRHQNLGSALHDLGQLDLAAASYRRAIDLQPGLAGAHINLAQLQQDRGRLDDAAESYRRAMEIQPGALENAIHFHLLLPIISDSVTEMATWRSRYQAGIETLRHSHTPAALENPGAGANPSSFFLAYHNQGDRPVMEALCRLFRERVAALTTHAACQSPRTRGDRIRVGFLSEYFCEHTIGKLYQGFIQHLDRTRFEVIVIRPAKAKRDAFSKHLDTLADRIVDLPFALPAQQQAVLAEKLDVLFYPDIGMAPSTYFLAFARLAPVQAVSWGHPDTTGLDSIDYFVSARSIEPDDAPTHYTERLIQLSRLPCHYAKLPAPANVSSRHTLGLPQTGTLYGCPQTLFKFHPDFDAVLAKIAEGDPTGHIVLLEGIRAAWAELLKARWAKTFPILLDRVIFLPRLSRQDFLAMTGHMDVLLDPLHFGSGNTLYEAMAHGTPIVTWPGQFARGRVVAGAYRQMGVADAPVVADIEDYAPLALALGRDPERRRSLCQASREAASRELFEDMAAVREFESFLEAAVAKAALGERLPTGWTPVTC